MKRLIKPDAMPGMLKAISEMSKRAMSKTQDPKKQKEIEHEFHGLAKKMFKDLNGDNFANLDKYIEAYNEFVKEVKTPPDNKHPNFEWTKYTYDELLDNNNPVQRQKFQSYCCGWLRYYDDIVRNGAVDHTIYFDWQGDQVVVYICPPPGSSKKAESCPPGDSTSDPQPPTAPPPPEPDARVSSS